MEEGKQVGRTLRCPTGKHRHASKGAAEAHLRSLVKIGDEVQRYAYPCNDCFGWHVGRDKEHAHRNRYAGTK